MHSSFLIQDAAYYHNRYNKSKGMLLLNINLNSTQKPILLIP